MFLAEDFFLANRQLEGQVIKTNVSLAHAKGYACVGDLVKEKRQAWENERIKSLQAHVAETQDCEFC